MLSELAVELLGRCTFPGHSEQIDCAVSGGKDSLALLVLAVAAGCEVTAYHVDHHLRPGSDKEGAVVADAAERLGAKFVALRVDCSPGPNLEARARAARQAVLPRDSATGHTADDQAETILINLLRGAGLDGLSGMRPGRFHPILSLRRAETARLVDSMGLSFVSDPSNDDPSILRNRVRHELLPQMSDIARRDLVPILCRQAELLADEATLLDELSGAITAHDAHEVARSPIALARRALRSWLAAASPAGYPPPAAAIERVLQVARGDIVATELPGGARLRRSRGELLLQNQAPGSARRDESAEG